MMFSPAQLAQAAVNDLVLADAYAREPSLRAEAKLIRDRAAKALREALKGIGR